MPFGKHNAAIPEMKYKLPKEFGDKQPNKLSYFDIINKKKENLQSEEKKGKKDL